MKRVLWGAAENGASRQARILRGKEAMKAFLKAILGGMVLLLVSCSAPAAPTTRSVPRHYQVLHQTRPTAKEVKQRAAAAAARTQAARDRLDKIIVPFQLVMADVCPRPTRLTGGYLVSRHEDGKEYLDEVAKNGPFPDLQAGDEVTGATKSGNRLHLWLRRKAPKGGQDITLEREAALVATCPFLFYVKDSDYLNIYVDHGKVIISTGLVGFASQEELGIALGHELAHIVLQRQGAKEQRQTAGWLAGFLPDPVAENGADPMAFEMEADYLGLYITARAGLPIDGAPAFWKRLAEKDSVMSEPSLRAGKPSAVRRFRAMRQTIAEIAGKKAKGEPLVPTTR